MEAVRDQKLERRIILCSFLNIHRKTGANSCGCQEKMNVFGYGGLQDKIDLKEMTENNPVQSVFVCVRSQFAGNLVYTRCSV